MFVRTTNLLQKAGHQAIALNGQSVSGSSAVNGTAYDQLSKPAAGDALVVVVNGAATGSPDSYTLDYKIQESADNSNWDDVTGLTAQAADDNQMKVIAFRPGDLKQYLRLVATPEFTGGTTPDVIVSGVLILADLKSSPV